MGVGPVYLDQGSLDGVEPGWDIRSHANGDHKVGIRVRDVGDEAKGPGSRVLLVDTGGVVLVVDDAVQPIGELQNEMGHHLFHAEVAQGKVDLVGVPGKDLYRYFKTGAVVVDGDQAAVRAGHAGVAQDKRLAHGRGDGPAVAARQDDARSSASRHHEQDQPDDEQRWLIATNGRPDDVDGTPHVQRMDFAIRKVLSL